MKVYRNILIACGLAVLFGLPLAASAQTPQVHRHRGKMESMLKEVAPEFSFAETALEKDVKRENIAVNKSRTLEAFTIGGLRIFIKERKTNKIFELRGLPYEWRDFWDLAWSSDQTLMFDRWIEPHYGNHYVFNMTQRKLLEAVPFPDEFMLKLKAKLRRERQKKRVPASAKRR